MMGPTHALSGLAAGAATLPFAPVSTLREQLAWTVCWGGMALLPDLDARGTTAARMWGPITTTLAGGVGALARGHRKGTHDLLVAPAVFGGLAALAAGHRHAAFVVLALAVGLSLHAIHWAIPGKVERTWPGNLLISVVVAIVFTRRGVDTTWLPYAVAGGVLVHIAGDALTTERVPVPFTWMTRRTRRIGIPLADTNTWLEPLMCAACSVLGLWQLAVHTGCWPAVQGVFTDATGL